MPPFDVFLPDDSDLVANLEDLRVGADEPLPGLGRIRIDAADVEEVRRRIGGNMTLTSSDDLAALVREALLPKIPATVPVVPAAHWVLHESREEEEEEEEETKTEEGEEKPAKPRTKADGRGAPSPEPSGGEATRGDPDAKGEQAAHVLSARLTPVSQR